MEIIFHLTLTILLYAWPVAVTGAFYFYKRSYQKTSFFITKSVSIGYLLFLLGLLLLFLMEIWKESVFFKCSYARYSKACNNTNLKIMDFFDDYGFLLITLTLIILHCVIIHKTLQGNRAVQIDNT